MEENKIAEPIITQKKSLPIVWLLPMIALLIGCWLVYKSITEADIIAKLKLSSGVGIVPGRTEVRYKGIPVGKIKTVQLNQKLDGVTAELAIDRTAGHLLKEQTLFWLVKPRVSMQGVSGLDTIMSGSYVDLKPGGGAPKFDFVALPKPPSLDQNEPGLHLTLKSEDLGSIHYGAPIMYRKVIVGSVQGHSFNQDHSGIVINVHIKEPYMHLVTESTRFFNSSGISISGGLSGIEVRTESLASIIGGGISFFTPAESEEKPVAKNGDTFKLFKDYKSADAGIPITIKFKTAAGLVPGSTKILYKGLEAGVLRKVDIAKTLDGMIGEFVLAPRAAPALNKTAFFWLVKPKLSFSGVSGLDALFSGTYIEMDFKKLGGDPQRDYVILENQPIDEKAPGLHINLLSRNLSSVSVGTGIYYRRLKVGWVLGYDLTKGGGQVRIKALIDKPYAHLVTTTSRFWEESGISIEGGLSGVSIKTGSVEAILNGGIAFASVGAKGKRVRNGYKFGLFENYKEAHQDGIPIKITFSTAEGIEINTPIKYQGIEVGKVASIDFGNKSSSILTGVVLEPKAKHLAAKGSYFWIVKPKLGLANTSNLGTLVTGSYITVQPGKGPFKNSFKGYDQPPTVVKEQEGLDLVLIAKHLGSIKSGVKIAYRGVSVGKVTGYKLADTAHEVLLYVNIEKGYANLIRANTKFWNVSGVGVDFSIFRGTRINMNSMESMLEGGIAFATPNMGRMGKPASPNDRFKLHDEPDEDWLKWNPKIDVQ